MPISGLQAIAARHSVALGAALDAAWALGAAAVYEHLAHIHAADPAMAGLDHSRSAVLAEAYAAARDRLL